MQKVTFSKTSRGYSPLRYAGGKNRLAKLIEKICVDNKIDGHYVEPYAGGASVALHLLIEQKVKKITINDYDRSIYAFWHTLLHHTKALCERIVDTEITIENWYKAKAIHKKKKEADLFELGFSTFFLNRTNVSGILGAGVMGGVRQQGRYKLDCRFNKKALVEKILFIANHRKDIHLYNLDALELVQKTIEQSKSQPTLFYLDPPYYDKGQSLYPTYYRKGDHEKLAEALKSLKTHAWLLSYDDDPNIREIYRWAKSFPYTLNHHAHHAKKGQELLFFSEKLKSLTPKTYANKNLVALR